MGVLADDRNIMVVMMETTRNIKAEIKKGRLERKDKDNLNQMANLIELDDNTYAYHVQHSNS